MGSLRCTVGLLDANVARRRATGTAFRRDTRFALVGAGGPEEAGRLWTRDIDVLVIDSDDDGIHAVVSELRETSPATRVVVLTARRKWNLAQRCLEAGASLTLDRLIEADLLRDTVAALAMTRQRRPRHRTSRVYLPETG